MLVLSIVTLLSTIFAYFHEKSSIVICIILHLMYVVVIVVFYFLLTEQDFVAPNGHEAFRYFWEFFSKNHLVSITAKNVFIYGSILP